MIFTVLLILMLPLGLSAALIFRGAHQKRRWLGAGMFILLSIFFICSAIIWNLHGWPWHMQRNLASDAQTAPASAINQSDHRLQINEMDPKALNRLIDADLAFQADLSKPWDPKLGDWIENCELARKISNAAWTQYLSQGWEGVFVVKVRSKVRQGDPMPYLIEAVPRRGGDWSQLMLWIKDAKADWVAVDGPVQFRDGMRGGWNNFGGGRVIQWAGQADPDELPPLGVHRIEVHATAIAGFFSQTEYQVIPEISKPLGLSATVTILPETQQTVELIDRPELANAVRASLKVEILPGTKQPVRVIRVSSDRPPVGLSFEVYIRANGTEKKAGSLACPAGTAGDWGMSDPGNIITQRNVDVIFRTSLGAAIQTVDTFEAWKGEIVVKNVPVL